MATQLRNAIAAEDEASRQAMSRTLAERSSPQAQVGRQIAANDARTAARAPFSASQGTPAAQTGAERIAASRAAVIGTEQPGAAVAERMDWNRQVRPGLIPEPVAPSTDPSQLRAAINAAQPPAPASLRTRLAAQPPAGQAIAERMPVIQPASTPPQPAAVDSPAAAPTPARVAAPTAAPFSGGALSRAQVDANMRAATGQPAPTRDPTPTAGFDAEVRQRAASMAQQRAAAPTPTPAGAAAPFSRVAPQAAAGALRTGLNSFARSAPGVGLAMMAAGAAGDMIVDAVQNPQSPVRRAADKVREFFATGQPQILRPANAADAYSPASVPTTAPGINQTHLPAAPAAPAPAAPPVAAPATVSPGVAPPATTIAAPASRPAAASSSQGPFTRDTAGLDRLIAQQLAKYPEPVEAGGPFSGGRPDGSVIVDRAGRTTIARPSGDGFMVEEAANPAQLTSLDPAGLIQYINDARAKGDVAAMKVGMDALGTLIQGQNQANVANIQAAAGVAQQAEANKKPILVGGGDELVGEGPLAQRVRQPTRAIDPATGREIGSPSSQPGRVITQAQAEALRAALAQSNMDEAAINGYFQANGITVR